MKIKEYVKMDGNWGRKSCETVSLSIDSLRVDQRYVDHSIKDLGNA
jgi:hypothetical protein